MSQLAALTMAFAFSVLRKLSSASSRENSIGPWCPSLGHFRKVHVRGPGNSACQEHIFCFPQRFQGELFRSANSTACAAQGAQNIPCRDETLWPQAGHQSQSRRSPRRYRTFGASFSRMEQTIGHGHAGRKSAIVRKPGLGSLLAPVWRFACK